MTDWQPIETAPKDGTPVWLFSPEDNPQQFVGSWESFEDQGWWGYAGTGVTHWMPLPEPPK